MLKLNRKTYYDNVKNRINQADKYALVKEKIQEIYYGYEGQETYGYRPMWGALRDEGFKLSLETVRKLMRSLGIKTTIYHKNTGSRKVSFFPLSSPFAILLQISLCRSSHSL